MSILIPNNFNKKVGNDKEYSGICKVNGLKLVIYVKEEVVSGF